MDNLGSEVGQKMRCAVKAKLVELGTGGSAGYIDDELPDYVMIMVANKRSKQQMIEDLNLFLGTNTEIFVVWLHQVLEKLQEVTLPTQLLQKTKRKSQDASEIPNKKDKRDKKKDKKIKKGKEKSPEPSSSSNKTNHTPDRVTLPVPSISDVFANQLLQNASKTAEIETKVEMKAEDAARQAAKVSNDEFDIPTITEIAENAVEQVVRRKELNELEDLQKRINLAKRQLRAMGSEESEDEDFLNIKDDDVDEEFEDKDKSDQTTIDKHKKNSKNPSPIIFNKKNSNSSGSKPRTSKSNEIIKTESRLNNRDKFDKEKLERKSSILDRLGNNNNRRAEKELYVPGFRKKEALEKQNNIKDHSRRDKEKDHDHETKIKNNRIGSRVIVAPPKPEVITDEDDINVPVNSVVKIKPRPIIPSHKQASKNLLLRAVAEAQRSTSLLSQKSSRKLDNDKSSLKSSSRPSSNNKDNHFNQKTIKSNIIIEIPTHMEHNMEDDAMDTNSDEYIPEPVVQKQETDIITTNHIVSNEVYIPRSINLRHRIDIREKSANDSRTQFVVTLDGMYENKHQISKIKENKEIDKKTVRERVEVVTKKPKNLSKEILIKKTGTPPLSELPRAYSNTSSRSQNSSTIKSHKSSSSNNIGEKSSSPSSTRKTSAPSSSSSHNKLSSSSSHTIKKLTSSSSVKRSSASPIVKRLSSPAMKKLSSSQRSKPVKKLIITNDTTDDDEKDSHHHYHRSPTKEKLSRQRSKVSPIKFDLSKNRINSSKHEESQNDVGNKYDNIPPLLSAVSVPAEIKAKQKERCKYFPICRQGDTCEYHHPLTPCKAFPNCKFGDKCLYIHPNCKFDLTCTRLDCNFAHTRSTLSAPPLASHVVPVQNYKTITSAPLPAMCKFYPGCTNTICAFYHPKLCRFGKNCLNKVECNFYHHDLPTKDKLKWISPTNIL